MSVSGSAPSIAQGGCWVLADGLGGHAGGACASQTAVEAALASFDRDSRITPDALAAHIANANQAVLEAQKTRPDLASMRTTIVALVASPEESIWGHAGDSRLYYFRQGKLAAQTRDHSVPQRLVEAGEIPIEQIRFHEDRNRLLKALGARGELAPAILPECVAMEPGDAILLASDGFWEWVLESEMEADLGTSRNPREWLHLMEFRLKQRATANHDNYSAIAIRATPAEERPQ